MLALAACQPRNSSESPVFDAVRNNDAARIGQYLAEGGDPNLTNSQGDSLLFVASGARGGLEVVDRLLLGGADPNLEGAEGRTALHTAAGWCNVEIVARLIEGGANVSALDQAGRVPSDAVCSEPLERRAAVLELLSSAGG